MTTSRSHTLVSLSLFDVPVPAAGVDAFLDNSDAFWWAFDRYGEGEHRTLQVFTVRKGILPQPELRRIRGNTAFVFLSRPATRLLVRLLPLLRDASVVVFHNESLLSLLTGICAKLAGKRVAAFYHNELDHRPSALRRTVLNIYRRRVLDAALTTSLTLKRVLKPVLGCPVFLFPFGVDTNAFRVADRSPHEKLRVLYCGRISPEKKIEDVIDGIARSAVKDRVELTIAGEEFSAGQEYSRLLRAKIAETGIACRFAGHVPHAALPAVYASADVLVNMRPDEGFGKVFVEAMATGLPVIGRRGAPGVSRLIRHGDNGFVVDDPADLGRHLEQLLRTPSLCLELGTRGRCFVERELSLPASLASLTRCLDALLAGWEVDQAFHRQRSFPVLRRLKRLVLNQRTDVCNHVLVDGRPVHSEQAALVPFCAGKGIDVGCGSNKTHPSAFGVDLTAGGTPGLFGNQAGQVSVADVVAFGNILPFKSGSLDYVVARHNFEHYRDPVRTLQEWQRVVREGGTIAIVIPDETWQSTIPLDPTHYHVYTPESFSAFVSLVPGITLARVEPCVEDWSFLCVMTVTGHR